MNIRNLHKKPKPSRSWLFQFKRLHGIQTYKAKTCTTMPEGDWMAYFAKPHGGTETFMEVRERTSMAAMFRAGLICCGQDEAGAVRALAARNQLELPRE